ncbi:TIGR03503 family protein [Pseudoalteromonas sp. T1lg48]|uniref:TIGR03503 family protein n=1 Tax=Pseudoalteromonas sp. T1lg48 TaxID=2077100 RepID=UPI001F1B24D9|nr:TIGR03503 family protein [Pseudoalteromonas sp. T1lg48]
MTSINARIIARLMTGLVCLVSLGAQLGFDVDASEQHKLTLLSEGNELPLLNNRFRIDHDVDKITLLFFRRPGSPAVVLVRPDGSKLYAPHALNDEQLQWHDERGYDLIELRNPMPGPWQVVGQILHESRIMVLGDISLEVDTLPPLLFRGEIIKLTGRVLNDGEQVEVGHFHEVINLQVDFVSTNNNEFTNFGAGTEHVADFKDDGRGFDERPGDAIFTGEFRLDFAPGQWRPEIALTTPLIQRKVVQEPVVVKEPPLTYELIKGESGADHELVFRLDPELVKTESVLLQGRIFYPNNDEQAFSLPSSALAERRLKISNYERGRYEVEVEMFATNINGREFMANLPNHDFVITRPIEKAVKTSAAMSASIPSLRSGLPSVNTAAGVQDQLQSRTQGEGLENTFENALLVALGNLVILLFGGVLIRIFVLKKPLMSGANLLFWRKKQQSQLSASQANFDKNGSKSDKSGEILNLSMSDD